MSLLSWLVFRRETVLFIVSVSRMGGGIRGVSGKGPLRRVRVEFAVAVPVAGAAQHSPGGRPVSFGDLQRETDELVATGRDAVQVDSFDNDHPSREEEPMDPTVAGKRLHRKVINPYQTHPPLEKIRCPLF